MDVPLQKEVGIEKPKVAPLKLSPVKRKLGEDLSARAGRDERASFLMRIEA